VPAIAANQPDGEVRFAPDSPLEESGFELSVPPERTLVERPGILVSKDALIEAAWSGRLVEESNLPVQIAALRRVLGEAPGGDCWIETMPGRGYRFIGPIVTEMEKGAMAAPPQVDTAQEPAPTPRPDAERRQITAMSCELIGLSGRADGVGLEDLRDVVGAFQRCVSETVDRHEGLVVSRLGDAALVLFGYPAAHEYDAERAVRAGLVSPLSRIPPFRVGKAEPYGRRRFEPRHVALFSEPPQATVAKPTFSSSCALLRRTVPWRGR
jgi:DNA-binding winged helix-turn-helix (wHTH) protein